MTLRPLPSAIAASLARAWPMVEADLVRMERRSTEERPSAFPEPTPIVARPIKPTIAQKLAELPVGGGRIVYSQGEPVTHMRGAETITGGRYRATETPERHAWRVERVA